MILTILLIVATSFIEPVPSPQVPARPKEVPSDARVTEPWPTVHVYHWTRAESAGSRVQVYVYPVIDEWPDRTWGAEIVVTPQPFCCGAKKTSLKWRKSQPMRPTVMTFLGAGSGYRLDFEFQSTDCHCH